MHTPNAGTPWPVFTGRLEPHDAVDALPAPPPWRPHRKAGADSASDDRATAFRGGEHAIAMVNAALFLRRPLLITGKPGTGKSSLAYAVAHELRLGPVLRWPITSRSTLQQALYQYDAIGRLHASELARHEGTSVPRAGDFISLGPLGTALLPAARPRVLLVDEIDKSDLDLPSDLLNVFEEGEFRVPELERVRKTEPAATVTSWDGDQAEVTSGVVRCRAFPLVILTSNGEREFPPAFLRRCLRLDMPEPTEEELVGIVEAHLGARDGNPALARAAGPLIQKFLARRSGATLATDQLLDALFLTTGAGISGPEHDRVQAALLRALTADGGQNR